jgi:uncharacterized protein (TIGR02594 family)
VEFLTQLLGAAPWIALLVVFIGMSLLQWRVISALDQALSRPQAPALPAQPIQQAPRPLPAILPSPQLPRPAAPAAQPAAVPAASGPPPWFTWAQHEIGFHESPGNTGIQKYIDLAHCGAEGDPWCAIFANAALEASGVPGTRSASSQSFRTHPSFVKLDAPSRGAIVVYWRGTGPNSGIGHVGFYDGEDATHVRTLGGNENDQVLDEDLPKSSATFGLVGYWWPKGVALPGAAPVAMAPKVAAASAVQTGAPANQQNITGTTFGGQQSAYGGPIVDASPGVALPFHFVGARPQVQVTSRSNGTSVVCEIVDVGPWNTNDPYWTTNTRPQSETGTDMTGRKTNKAGIDLTLAAAQAIQLDGKGLVDWEFVQQSPAPPKVT